jgi:hypothetical protein
MAGGEMALWRIVIPLLFLLVTGSALGADTGYWTCSKGQWVPVGEPSYNRPLRDCMEKPPLPQSQQRCDALGGTWGPAGLFPKPICRMPARDAARICGDADECDSTCLARLSQAQIDRLRQTGATLTTLGRCATVYPVFGCLAIVEKGQVHGLLCLD